MKKLVYLTLIIISFSATHTIAAKLAYKQEKAISASKDSIDSDTTNDDNDRLFSFGIEYSTDKTHYGLHNNTYKLPYVEPNFTYTAPKGFFAGISDEYFFPKKIRGFDDLALNLGWSKDFGDNTTWDIDYTHYAIKNSPEIITAGLTNSIETYIVEWIGNLKTKFTVNYDIYQANTSPNDLVFTPDLTYKFKWKLGKGSALKLKPEVSLDLGTRNFYTQVLINKQNDTINQGGKLKGKKAPPNSNSSFGALDYNLILSIDLALGKFDIEPTFTYTDPLYKSSNLPSPPTGYMSLSILYTIATK